MASQNNLRQIDIALHIYADTYGHLPPAATYDSDGKPLLSWRVAILPFLEQQNLYNQFHLDEPWDSPHNIALLQSKPKVYHCPARPVSVNDDLRFTYYQAFVGPRTGFGTERGLRLPQDFPDGPSNTILLVEGRSAVPWTKPEDIAYDPEGPVPPLGGIFTGESRFNLFGRKNPKGFHVALADGTVPFVSVPFDESALREYIDRGNGTQKRSFNLFK
jgi:hypothetical protein